MSIISASTTSSSLQELVDEVQGAGKIIYAWTVNDPPANMSRLIDYGIDGLVTDDIAQARELLLKATWRAERGARVLRRHLIDGGERFPDARSGCRGPIRRRRFRGDSPRAVLHAMRASPSGVGGEQCTIPRRSSSRFRFTGWDRLCSAEGRPGRCRRTTCRRRTSR